MRSHARQAVAADGSWLMGVAGIVADNQDPEKQHRVKVIIPSIDEDVVYDEWARQMVFCLGAGFGTAFIPPKGSEVVLFGQLGQKYNLFYASVYNEDFMLPDGYPDENTAGAHAPGNLKFIAELLATLKGQNVEVIAAQLAKTTGQNIESLAQQLHKITGQNVESIAAALNKVAGQTVKLEGVTIDVGGTTVQISGSGSVSITGNAISVNGTAVTINGSSVTIRGRPVSPFGPPI